MAIAIKRFVVLMLGESECNATFVATAVLVPRDVITVFDTKGSMTPEQLADMGVLAKGAWVTLCRRSPEARISAHALGPSTLVAP
ncbi:MAG: hypothetical protein ACREXS_14365 [Gammaproteobacteria bacterium]